MSGSFVRASKFRHIFGEEAKKSTDRFEDLKPYTSGDGNFLAANTKYFAIAKNGGGGPAYVHSLDKTGRFPLSHPVVNVQKGKITDVAFHPFIDEMLYTASDDCTVAATVFPEGGLTENISKATVLLKGHIKKVALLRPNPTVNNILGSAGYDHHIKLWDVEAQEEKYTREYAAMVHSFAWSPDGNQILATCQNKKHYLSDPRTDQVTEFDAHTGAKKSNAFWLADKGWFASVGFSKRAQRRILFWDPRDVTKPLHEVDIDNSGGVIMPFYDPDVSILYTVGKGDGNIKYFEITDTKIHYVSDFRSAKPQKGAAFIPKLGCDIMKCEVAKILRLTRDTVEPVKFRVPRKNTDMFQADIFPDTALPVVSQEAAAWVGGADGKVTKGTPDPSKREASSGGGFQKQKSRDELQERIAYLTKQLADAKISFDQEW